MGEGQGEGKPFVVQAFCCGAGILPASDPLPSMYPFPLPALEPAQDAPNLLNPLSVPSLLSSVPSVIQSVPSVIQSGDPKASHF